MVCDIFNRRLYDKLEYANNVYAKLIYKTLFPVSDALYLETKEHFRLPPEGDGNALLFQDTEHPKREKEFCKSALRIRCLRIPACRISGG